MKKITQLSMLFAIPFLLTACQNQNENSKNSPSTESAQEGSALTNYGLKNQNDVTTWKSGNIEKPKTNSIPGITQASKANNDKLGSVPIVAEEATYFGGETLDEKVLFSDNIFVATVEDMETSYFGGGGRTEDAIPSTNFKLKVLENIKGELPVGKTIRSSRDYFGLNPDQQSFFTLIEEDTIPEKGKTYIFLAYAIEGDLKITENGDAKSNFALENSPMDLARQKNETITEVIDSSTVVSDFKNKVKNREQFLARARSTGGISFMDRLEAIDNGEINNKPDLNKIVVD